MQYKLSLELASLALVASVSRPKLSRRPIASIAFPGAKPNS